MNESLKKTIVKPKKVNSKYSEDWLPIKNINNGMIELDNNMKVTGVKIMPRNIFILDQNTQDNILIALKNFYNTLDFEFWLISADKPADISEHLSKLQMLYNEITYAPIKKTIMQDITKANRLLENNVCDTEYYILFKEKNIELIQKKIINIISGLANCGLTAKQTSNDDLRTVIENFLNAGTTTEFGTVIG